MSSSTATAPTRPASAVRRERLSRTRRVPPWAWLVGLVLVSTLVRYAFARRVVAPWIFQDELLYSELARGLAEHGEMRVRGEPFGGLFGVLYPLAIAPAYLLFDSLPTAYAAVKAVNGFLFSLAALPVYFLARRVTGPGLALVAAALSLAVPGGLYSGMVMTESLFYPLVLLVVLALVLALERPTPLRVTALLAAVGLAFAARAQAVVFVPVILAAPLLVVAFERTWARGLVRFRWLYGIPGAAGLLLLAALTARGTTPLELLGAYRPVLEREYHPELVARWLLWHVAHLDLSLGVLPFAALLLLLMLAPRLGRREHAFLAASATTAVAFVAQVSIFASAWSERVQERNMFAVMPLFLVALALWLHLGRPRPRIRSALALTVAVLLPLALPFPQLIDVRATSDTFGLLVWWSLVDGGPPAEDVWRYALALSLVLAVLFLVLPRRLALLLPVSVLVFLAVSTYTAHGWHRTASVGALFTGITHPERDWVDRAVGPDAEVAAVWSPHRHPMWVWQNEFFSHSVGDIYRLEAGMTIELPQTELVPNWSTGQLLDSLGREVRVDHVLVDDYTAVDGRLVARDETKGIRLLRVGGPLALERATAGIYPDAWSGREFEYRRYGCRGGRVHVALEQDPNLVSEPQRLVARDRDGRVVGRYTVHPGRERAWMSVPLAADADGNCDLSFTVTPTAVPADVNPGADDRRELGIRVLGFEHHTPADAR